MGSGADLIAGNTLREPRGERRGDFILNEMNLRPFVLRLSKHVLSAVEGHDHPVLA